jgi:hypothetical protein
MKFNIPNLALLFALCNHLVVSSVFPMESFAADTVFIGTSATANLDYEFSDKDGVKKGKITLTWEGSIESNAINAIGVISDQINAILDKKIDAAMEALSKAWEGVKKLFGGKTGEVIKEKESYFKKNQGAILVALNTNDNSSNLSEESLIAINKINKDFELIERDMKEFQIHLTSFYDNGNFDLRSINFVRNSSQKLRQSLSNFLINFKALSNDNSSPELLLAKQEILKSTQDLTNILEFTDQVLNAFDKAIAQSE